MKIKIAIIIGIILTIAGLILTKKPLTSSNNNQISSEQVNTQRIIVYISGEINRPGLYEINKGARLNELVILAGGFTKDADSVKINLASMLEDGAFFLIPSLKQGDQTQTTNLISLNRATKEDLMKLEGIGEVKAINILTYREINGPFLSLEDLLKVSGISSAVYDKIKNFITL